MLEVNVSLQSSEFLRQFVTLDETWSQHFKFEPGEQSKQWTEMGGSWPNVENTVALAGRPYIARILGYASYNFYCF